MWHNAKSLYTANFHYTEDAIKIDHKTSDLVHDLFAEYVNIGYSPREISQIMQSAINMIELEVVLNDGII